MLKASLLVPANVMAILLAGCGDGCRNDIVSRIASPDRGHSAVLFQRDCGATTGFSTQISVLPAGGEPADGGNVFRADSGRDAAIRIGSWQGPWAEMRWLSPRHLLIRYAAGARVFAKAEQMNGIRISYELAPVSPARP
jgi:hypothetical protein